MISTEQIGRDIADRPKSVSNASLVLSDTLAPRIWPISRRVASPFRRRVSLHLQPASPYTVNCAPSRSNGRARIGYLASLRWPCCQPLPRSERTAEPSALQVSGRAGLHGQTRALPMALPAASDRGLPWRTQRAPLFLTDRPLAKVTGK